MKYIKKITLSFVLLTLLAICLLSFFIASTPGLYTLIKISALSWPGSLTLHQIKGRLLDQFFIEEVSYQDKNKRITIKRLRVSWDFKSLLHHQLPIRSLHAESIEYVNSFSPEAPLHIEPRLPFEIQLDKLVVEEFSFKTPHSSHRFHSIQLAAYLKKDAITIHPLIFHWANQTIQTQLTLNISPPQKITGTMAINPHATNPKHASGKIRIEGVLSNLKWTGVLSTPSPLTIQGHLKQGTQFNQIIKWKQLTWPTPKITAELGRLKMTGTLPKLTIELDTKINTKTHAFWQMHGLIHGVFPWHWHAQANLLQPASSKKAKGLYTAFSAKGTLNDSTHGVLNLTVGPGHYQLPQHSPITAIPFKGGHLNITLSPSALKGQGFFEFNPNEQAHFQWHLPGFKWQKGFTPKQKCSGHMTLLFNSLNFLKKISPEIDHFKGQMKASLKGHGTLEKIHIESDLALRKASFSVPQLGLNLQAIELALHAQKNKWRASGSLSSENQKLTLQGEGPLNKLSDGHFSVEGVGVPIIKTSEYEVHATPHLNLSLKPSAVAITGRILIPYARIKPHVFTNSLSLPEDVVYQSHEKKQPTGLNTSLDIQVEMGKEVEVSFKGLRARLGGQVHLSQTPKGSVNASGDLSVIKGEYKAYGQDLAIEQGDLLFTGGPLINPGVNLRASKKIEPSSDSLSGANPWFDFKSNPLQNLAPGTPVTVGVEVSGRLTAPKIQLFSNPAILSQADILSMLVLGKPASQASKAGGQLLLTALSSMDLGNHTNGAQLIEQLKENLGFDFNVQTTTNYNQTTNQLNDTTGFVVGKKLSKRIYLSYNIGVSHTDPNVLTLKYLLNQFFSLQINSSDNSNGIDFLYTSNQ